MQYTFFHLSPDNSIPSFDVIFCEGEGDLQRRITAVFSERMRCRAIEVQDERGRVFTVERQA